MHSRLEKPIVREERAETSAAALIKSLFQLPEATREKPKREVLKRKG